MKGSIPSGIRNPKSTSKLRSEPEDTGRYKRPKLVFRLRVT